MTSAVEVPKESPVDTELGALHKGLDEVHQALRRLSDRLAPVSIPVPEGDARTSPPNVASSRGKVCDSLTHANNKISDLVDSLRIIIDRLTV